MDQFLWSAEAQTFLPLDSEQMCTICIPEGLLLGYSVFTSFRFPCNQAFLEKHQARLQAQTKHVGLTLPVWPDEKVINAFLQSYDTGESPVAVRLTVYPELTGGVQALLSQSTLSGSFLLSLQPFVPLVNQSQVLKTVDYSRPYPQIKHGGLLHELHLKRQSCAQPDDKTAYTEVLWINKEGEVTEATTANVVLAFLDETLGQLRWQTPASAVCLSGLVREQLCVQGGVQEACIHREALKQVQAAFLSNSVRGLMRVSQIDDRRLPWPQKAQAAFENFQNQVQTACFSLEM